MNLRKYPFGWPWKRLHHLGRSAQRRTKPKQKARLEVESLEGRSVPTTSPWTLVTAPLPASDTADTMLLLPDGSVMVHGHNGAQSTSADWYELTPDSTGSYANGFWKVLPPMNLARFDFSSDVLPDGRVFVLGGEYSGPDGTLNETDTGEVFDPSANGGQGKWTYITSFPGPDLAAQGIDSIFGDNPTEVLNDRTILCAYRDGSETLLYDPTKDPLLNPKIDPNSDPWSLTNGSHLFDGNQQEETWVKLPDGSILSYDIFYSNATGTPTAERYFPSTGRWVATGPVPVALSSAAAVDEIGPALLLPDGRAFWLGATGNTAFYNPATNTWTAGPQIPQVMINGVLTSVVAADAPAAMMPNGEILFAASPAPFLPKGAQPIPQNYIYPGPTTILSFAPTNPTESGFADVTDTSFLPQMVGNKPGIPDYATKMLVLPTGQIMLSASSGNIDLYNNGTFGSLVFPPNYSNPAWQPVITKIVNNGDGSFTLTGTQLNGLSEGANFGDDAEMASNYPIIQLTGFFGNVSYARTFDWSSTGVATGSTPETTRFTLPAGTAPGVYKLSVIANGIASNSVLFVQMGAGANELSLRVDPTNSTNLQVLQAGTLIAEYPFSAFPGGIMVAGSGLDALTLDLSNGNPIPVAGISYDGGGGDNEILVTGSTSLTTTLSDTSLTVANAGTVFGTVSLSRVDQAVLTGGPSGNNFTVTGWTGVAQVNGQGVTNSLSITAPAGANVMITGSAVTFGSTSIGYAGVQALGVSAGAGSAFTVSPTAHDLDELPATVTIKGGSSSTAVLDDQSNKPEVSSTWAVSGSSVTRSYATYFIVQGRVVVVTTTRTINYSGLGALTLNGGPDSVFTLSPVVQNLDELPATVVLSGGPSSTAALNDQNNKPDFGSSWTVNSTSVTRSSSTLVRTLSGAIVVTTSRTINLSGLASGLRINTDNTGDTVTVNITHSSGYNLTVHGGSGSNTLNLDEVVGDRGGPFNPNPAPQGSGTVTAAYTTPGLPSTFTYTNMEIVTQLPNPDKSFVQALYHTALGRDATQAELDQWAAQIPTLGREGVARAINHLPEAFDHVITVDYQTYLHEAPPEADEARLEKLFEHGASEEQVLADILASNAFFQQATKGSVDERESADVRYIEALFQDLLGYKEDQLNHRQMRFWVDRLDEVGRRGVALELLMSESYRKRAITAYFSSILHDTQPPSAAEVDKLADSDKDLLAIQIELEGSAAFYRNGR
jgi:hypothetical protein